MTSSTPSVPAPPVFLKVALFGAAADFRLRLAEGLNRALAESGHSARVLSCDAAAASLDLMVFDAVFLQGLRSSDPVDLSRQIADDSIRAALRRAGAAYQVLYGTDTDATGQVMRRIEELVTASPVTPVLSEPGSCEETARPWVWLCDKCSDPQCEHRLLTALLEQRQEQRHEQRLERPAL